MIALLLLSCSEFRVDFTDTIDPVDPPGDNWNPQGDVPDWDDCLHGFEGMYFNHNINHEDIEPEFEPYPQEDPLRLDWWDDQYQAFHHFDATLDFGTNWWPVDEDFENDPQYFSVKWHAWIRINEAGSIDFVIGAADDIWIIINDEVVYEDAGIKDFSSGIISIPLEAGQFPIEVLYAHRSGDNGLRFRLVDENATICYPEY